jgi:NADPH-dependent curcumin reductase CurA
MHFQATHAREDETAVVTAANHPAANNSVQLARTMAQRQVGAAMKVTSVQERTERTVGFLVMMN